jgi:ABC-type uncharacterized transport system substrate-binding protein
MLIFVFLVIFTCYNFAKIRVGIWKKVLKIGTTQMVEHPALDSIRKGIIDQLAEEGFKDGETIHIDYYIRST